LAIPIGGVISAFSAETKITHTISLSLSDVYRPTDPGGHDV
jgi:hypothetical protein